MPIIDSDTRQAVRKGSFTAAGAPVRNFFAPRGAFNVTIWGTFTGTLVLERLLPGESEWVPVSLDLTGAAASFTAPVSLTSREVEAGTLYRFNCTALSAGEAFWRLSQ